MKINKPIVIALLALAGTALTMPSASATGLPWSTGDLLFGLRALGGGATTTDYEVDLGNALNYLPGGGFATGAPVTLSLGNIGTDFSNIYGSDWYTNSTTDIQWSVAGSTQSSADGSIGAYTLFATSASSTPGTSYNPGSSFGQHTPANDIAAMLGASGQGYGLGDSAGNGTQTLSANSSLGLIQSTSAPDSYASFQSGGFSYGKFTPYVEGATTADLTLFEVVPGTSSPVDLGTFALSSGGDVTFTSAAVPEPSTYAAVFLGAGVLILMGRRRSIKA